MAIRDKNEGMKKPSDGKTAVEMLSDLTTMLMQELIDSGVTPEEIFEKGLFNEGYPVTSSLENINKLSKDSKSVMDSIAKKAIEPVIEQMRQKEKKMQPQEEQSSESEAVPDNTEVEPESVQENAEEPDNVSEQFSDRMLHAYNVIADGADDFAELFKPVPKVEAVTA